MNDKSLTISPLMSSLAAFALVGFVLLLLRLSSPILVPILFAFFLAALALPGFRWLQRKGVKRGLALFLLIVFLLALGVGLILLILVSVARLQSGLDLYTAQLSARMSELTTALANAGLDLTALSEPVASFSAAVLGGLLGGIVNAASNALVSLVIVAFFLLESERLLAIIRSDAVQKRPLLSQLPEVARTAVRYFGIRTRLNLITGLGVTLLCWLVGVDYAPLWGVVAFFLSYIPYIGLATAMIPPAILALAEFGWLQAAIIVIGITALNMLIENVLEPGYTGKRLQLSPTIVFVSFFFWAWLLGPIGALLSMPITVMLVLVFQGNDSTQWLARMMGNAPAGETSEATATEN
ncbi:MAG: AI-2E family transporter [Chloroflexota bacterium]